jgi:hypothetical protein
MTKSDSIGTVDPTGYLTTLVLLNLTRRWLSPDVLVTFVTFKVQGASAVQ